MTTLARIVSCRNCLHSRVQKELPQAVQVSLHGESRDQRMMRPPVRMASCRWHHLHVLQQRPLNAGLQLSLIHGLLRQEPEIILDKTPEVTKVRLKHSSMPLMGVCQCSTVQELRDLCGLRRMQCLLAAAHEIKATHVTPPSTSTYTTLEAAMFRVTIRSRAQQNPSI